MYFDGGEIKVVGINESFVAKNEFISTYFIGK
jgi:hypothetical protein